MEQVRNILRGLLRRALVEHGADTPALADITIEPASGRVEPRLRVHFANGHSAWAPVLPHDFYALCEQHSAWDLQSLRRAVLREAHAIYARMCAEYQCELDVAREPRGMAAGILERLCRRADRRNRPFARRPSAEAAPDPVRDEMGGLPRRQEAQRRLLEWWAQQRHEYARTAFFGHGLSSDIGSKRAQERGLALLEENLAPSQRQQYEKYGYFDVVGGRTGKRYRIRHGRQMNIEQLDRNGRRVCGWCFYPQGSLVAGDVMLAQKVALELFEADALSIANRF
jgi:hypothetical protein